MTEKELSYAILRLDNNKNDSAYFFEQLDEILASSDSVEPSQNLSAFILENIRPLSDTIATSDGLGGECNMSTDVSDKEALFKINKPPSELKGMTVTHNHPCVAMPLSDADIQSAILYDLDAIDVIGVHNEKHLIYRMQAPDQSWPKIFMNKTLEQAALKLIKENADYFKAGIDSGSLSREDISIWAKNQALVEFAAVYGLIYSVEEVIDTSLNG